MRKGFGTMVLITALVLTGCGGGAAKPTATRPLAATSTSAVPRPTNTKAAAQPPVVAEEYNFDQASDLSSLSSYRMHYIFKWESTKADQKDTGSWDVVEEFVRQPPAHHLLWTSTGAGEEGKWEIIQIGKDVYMDSGSGWFAVLSGEADIFEANRFLSDPFNVISGNRGKLVQKNVMVNGVSTNHYIFDESSLGPTLGLGVIAKAKGDVWVSPEFGVAVRYVAHYEGENLAIGSGEAGVLDLAFDLTDLNKPVTIKAPEGVKPAMPEDIPIMDGATELSAVLGIVTYKTTKSVEEVIAFYDAQMPGAGWTKGEGAIPGMMSFAKGDRAAQILIDAQEGKTNVTIMAGQ